METNITSRSLSSLDKLRITLGFISHQVANCSMAQTGRHCDVGSLLSLGGQRLDRDSCIVSLQSPSGIRLEPLRTGTVSAQVSMGLHLTTRIDPVDVVAVPLRQARHLFRRTRLTSEMPVKRVPLHAAVLGHSLVRNLTLAGGD